jgi:hypothetical protein
MANAFRTPQELALAADHYLALAATAPYREDQVIFTAKAQEAIRLMWAATAREQGWS